MADAPKPGPAPAKYEPPKELEGKAAVQKFQGRPKRKPEDQAEYFYNVKVTHIVMFASSLAMLISFLLMFRKDYVRDWKHYQTEFAQMDFEKLWYELSDLRRQVETKEREIQAIDAQAKDFLSQINGRKFKVSLFAKDLPPPPGLEKAPWDEVTVEVDPAKQDLKLAEKEKIRGEHYNKQQLFNFAKDRQGAVRYRIEEAEHHTDEARRTSDKRLESFERHLDHARKDWAAVLKEVAERKKDFDHVDRRNSFYEDFAARLKASEIAGFWEGRKPLAALLEEKARIRRELEDKETRFAKERPGLVQFVRNAPMADFFGPTLKVRQVILPNIKDQLNFAKVDKVDRCHTCHVGIDNPAYEVVIDPHAEDDLKKYTFKDEFLRKFVAHATGKGEPRDCVVCDPEGRAKREIKEPVTKHGAWSSDDAIRFVKTSMAHPRLDLYVMGSSKHPLDKIGCTICHEGDGRMTDFSRTVHSPDSAKEGQDWRKRHGTPFGEERYNWNYRELWDLPMIQSKNLQASCRRCHTEAVEIDGGDRYVKAMKLFERSGCYGCHRTDTYNILPKDKANPGIDINSKNRRPGPPLTRIATKVTEDWAAKWVLDPRGYRPTTRMPHFFGQSNCRNEVNKNPYPAKGEGAERRSPVDDAIVTAIVKYLWSLSETRPEAPMPATLKGDAKRGGEIAQQVGCAACHKFEATTRDSYGPAESAFLKEFGPNLSGIGSKIKDKSWLYQWVRDPKRHFRDSSMPNLRLTEQEAADVVEYLMALRNPGFEAKAAPPPVNPKLVDDLIFEQLQKTMPDVFAQKALAGDDRDFPEFKDFDGKLRWFGRKMVKNFGCYSCHQLPNEPEDKAQRKGAVEWHNEEGIGVELTGSQPFGSKHHDRLDFGFTAYDGVNHNGVTFEHGFSGKVEPGTSDVKVHETRQDWLRAKLLNPRVFDGGKMKSKPWDELLRMPNFGFSEYEAELLSTFVLSFTDHKVAGLVDNAVKRLGPDEVARERGNRVVRENNCAGCHRLSLDTFEITWERTEKGKPVKSREWVEGRKGPRAPGDNFRDDLKAYGFITDTSTAEEVARFSRYKIDWTVDHRTLERSPAVNYDNQFVVTDGHDWWYLDTDAEKKPVRRAIHRNLLMDGGEILPHLLAYKTQLNKAYKKTKEELEEKVSDLDDQAKKEKDPAKKKKLTDESKELQDRIDAEFEADDLVKVGDAVEMENRYPPMLRTQGIKTQSEWLFRFLKKPWPLRGNIFPLSPEAKKLKDVSIRMPTFELEDEEAAALVRWFAVRDHLPGTDFAQTVIPEPDEATKPLREKLLGSLLLENSKGCASCHWAVGRMPPGDPIKHAPDLLGVGDRLRPRWLEAWLKEPGAVYPGTMMTAVWPKWNDPKEGAAQLQELRATAELLMHLRRISSTK